jgi:hypothetical protein
MFKCKYRNYLELIKRFSQCSKTPICNIYSIWVFWILVLIRMANPCCFQIRLPHLPCIHQFIHPNSLPVIPFPQYILQRAQQHPNMILDWSFPNPLLYLSFINSLCIVPLIFLFLFIHVLIVQVILSWWFLYFRLNYRRLVLWRWNRLLRHRLFPWMVLVEVKTIKDIESRLLL